MLAIKIINLKNKYMKKLLTKIEYNLYHIKDGVRIKGVHSKLYGNVSGLSGNVSGLSGYVSGLSGDVSGLSGNVSGLYGNVSGLFGYVSGLSGDVSDCEITDEDRAKGIDISELIKE